MSETVKPCPCCGEYREYDRVDGGAIGLRVGAIDACTRGIVCENCKLQIGRKIPNRWPVKAKQMTHMDALAWLEQEATRRAIEAWNRRTP